jgi:lysophospholipase L1-like esterase
LIGRGFHSEETDPAGGSAAVGEHEREHSMAGQSVVLLGDSILDNGPYTRPEPDTTAHLQRLLGSEWSVQRLARDGARLSDLRGQLGELTTRPTLSVLSIGGNDITAHIGLLERRSTSSGALLGDLLGIAEDFDAAYEAAARAVAERAERTMLCTIYEARLEPPIFARLARVPLAVLNDRILRIGARLGLDVLELRSICTEPGDYVMQIEPSAQGAAKIARAIASVLKGGEPLRSGRVFSA